MTDSLTQADFWPADPDESPAPRRTIREVLADGVTASVIKQLLRWRHEQPRADWSAWAFFDEFIPGTGTSREAGTRMDGWAINVWPSGGFVTIAYEIKISRSDFLRELKDPYKREWALTFSDEFYFVAPIGLIKRAELPADCGLVEVKRGGERGGMYKLADGREFDMRVNAKPAPRMKQSQPSWALLAAVARRSCRAESSFASQPTLTASADPS